MSALSSVVACAALLAADVPPGPVLVLPPVVGEDLRGAEAMGALLAQEVARQGGRRVITAAELEPTARERSEGCGDAACAVTVGREAGAVEVVFSRLDRVGSQHVLVARRVRVVDGRVAGTSATRVPSGDPAAVLDALPAAVAELQAVRAAAPAVRGRPIDVEGAPREPVDAWLGFEVEPGHGASLDWGAVAYPVEGPGKARLSWSEFYRRVGRVDLAEAFEERARARQWIAWLANMASAGVMLVLGLAGLTGLALLLPSLQRGNAAPAVPPALAQPEGPLWWAGLGLVVVSLLAGLLFFIGDVAFPSPSMLVPAQPLGEADIRALADGHNRSP